MQHFGFFEEADHQILPLLPFEVPELPPSVARPPSPAALLAIGQHVLTGDEGISDQLRQINTIGEQYLVLRDTPFTPLLQNAVADILDAYENDVLGCIHAGHDAPVDIWSLLYGGWSAALAALAVFASAPPAAALDTAATLATAGCPAAASVGTYLQRFAQTEFLRVLSSWLATGAQPAWVHGTGTTEGAGEAETGAGTGAGDTVSVGFTVVADELPRMFSAQAATLQRAGLAAHLLRGFAGVGAGAGVGTVTLNDACEALKTLWNDMNTEIEPYIEFNLDLTPSSSSSPHQAQLLTPPLAQTLCARLETIADVALARVVLRGSEAVSPPTQAANIISALLFCARSDVLLDFIDSAAPLFARQTIPRGAAFELSFRLKDILAQSGVVLPPGWDVDVAVPELARAGAHTGAPEDRYCGPAPPDALPPPDAPALHPWSDLLLNITVPSPVNIVLRSTRLRRLYVVFRTILAVHRVLRALVAAAAARKHTGAGPPLLWAVIRSSVVLIGGIANIVVGAAVAPASARLHAAAAAAAAGELSFFDYDAAVGAIISDVEQGLLLSNGSSRRALGATLSHAYSVSVAALALAEEGCSEDEYALQSARLQTAARSLQGSADALITAISVEAGRGGGAAGALQALLLTCRVHDDFI